jgi:hypothetical protein
MNQRIREITGQVLDELVPETWTKLGYDKIKEIQNRTAELIVRECISMADKESERYSNLDQEYCSMAMDNYRELVRKHFGVEE